MNVLGLDLSLTSSGYAMYDGDTFTVGRIRPKTKGPERLIEVREAVREFLATEHWDMVCVEGYAFGAQNQASHVGELGGVIRVLLHEYEENWLEIPPTSLKKWATGKGNANKELMLACAIRELGYLGSSNDEADAMWLAHLGYKSFYTDQVTADRRATLSRITGFWEPAL